MRQGNVINISDVDPKRVPQDHQEHLKDMQRHAQFDHVLTPEEAREALYAFEDVKAVIDQLLQQEGVTSDVASDALQRVVDSLREKSGRGAALASALLDRDIALLRMGSSDPKEALQTLRGGMEIFRSLMLTKSLSSEEEVGALTLDVLDTGITALNGVADNIGDARVVENIIEQFRQQFRERVAATDVDAAPQLREQFSALEGFMTHMRDIAMTCDDEECRRRVAARLRTVADVLRNSVDVSTIMRRNTQQEAVTENGASYGEDGYIGPRMSPKRGAEFRKNRARTHVEKLRKDIAIYEKIVQFYDKAEAHVKALIDKRDGATSFIRNTPEWQGLQQLVDEAGGEDGVGKLRVVEFINVFTDCANSLDERDFKDFGENITRLSHIIDAHKEYSKRSLEKFRESLESAERVLAPDQE